VSGFLASLTAGDVAAEVTRRLKQQTWAVGIYWVAVADARADYAAALNGQFAGEAAMAVVVRGAGFENPNCVFDDFVDLVRSERRGVEEHLIAGETSERCAIVLVAHSELRVVQASSPVVLPEWFPISGGETVTGRIEDLTWVVEAPLNTGEARVPELCRLMFRLEGDLLTRLVVARSNPRTILSLFDRVKRDSESLADFLTGAESSRARITNPEAYRPSLKEQQSLLARLLLLVQKEKPAGLTKPAQALASALNLPDAIEIAWHESLPAVLGRPPNPDSSDAIRFARGLLLTLSASAQYVTAAAHADAYRAYPVPLLRATSYDLRRGLSDAAAVVRAT
jgi:hypothetical protein